MDDDVAVRTALELPVDHAIPVVTKIQSPKDEINRLVRQSPRLAEMRTLELLAEIAKCIDPRRCQHAKESGFEDFADDVRHEFGPIVGG